jgi:hypothetical protein
MATVQGSYYPAWNSRGACYHVVGKCIRGRTMTVTEARHIYGLTPCSKCKPPMKDEG